MNQRRKERQSRTTGLGEALRLAIADLGVGAKLMEQRALLAWQEAAVAVVGEALAGGTRAKSIRNGEMTVAVQHDALRHRLLFERERLCSTINERLGRQVVQSIRFGR